MLDTRSKRASAIGVLLPIALAVPAPDGTVDAADRAHLAQTYSGIESLSFSQCDDFTAGNFSAPNPSKWTVNGSGEFVVHIQDGRLQLIADGAAGQSTAAVDAVMPVAPSLQIDGDIIIPGPGTRFFAHFTPRRIDASNEYFVRIQRGSAVAEPEVHILRRVSDGLAVLAGPFALSDAVTHYRVRAFVDGFDLKCAVRDFDAGPVVQGDWDLETSDGGANFATGIARVAHVAVNSDNERSVSVDDVCINAPPPEPPPPIPPERSAIGVLLPWSLTLPVANVGIGRADRQHVARLYGPVAATGPAPEVAAFSAAAEILSTALGRHTGTASFSAGAAIVAVGATNARTGVALFSAGAAIDAGEPGESHFGVAVFSAGAGLVALGRPGKIGLALFRAGALLSPVGAPILDESAVLSAGGAFTVAGTSVRNGQAVFSAGARLTLVHPPLPDGVCILVTLKSPTPVSATMKDENGELATIKPGCDVG